MLKKIFAVMMAGTILVGVAADVQAAQGRNPVYNNGYNDGYEGGHRDGYDDAYRDAYRRGFDDARARRRFNDNYRYPGPGNNYGPNYSNNGNDDRDNRWRQRYQRTYSYNDDTYYQQCRTQPDPAGVIAGALIGGLLGNAVGRGGGRAGLTVAGVVVGGVAGAALTSHLNCEDRSYAYKTYSDGFNSGRPNSDWAWRNPSSGHNGNFRVGDYYNDPDGFRCSTYSQVIYINGRPEETRGRACQQPDGTWAIVS